MISYCHALEEKMAGRFEGLSDTEMEIVSGYFS